MLTRPVYDEAEAARPNDVRPRLRPRIFIDAEVDATIYETEVEASCLLLLQVQDTY